MVQFYLLTAVLAKRIQAVVLVPVAEAWEEEAAVVMADPAVVVYLVAEELMHMVVVAVVASSVLGQQVVAKIPIAIRRQDK